MNMPSREAIAEGEGAKVSIPTLESRRWIAFEDSDAMCAFRLRATRIS